MPSSITLTVNHLPTSTSFFLSALQPLNYVFRGREEQTIGFGPKDQPTALADFWITQEIPGVPAGAAHVAFPAASRDQVQEFFYAALKAGGKIHGEPCQRDASGYYSAAVIDFDGNSIEAVYRPALDEANKENLPDDAKTTVSRKAASVAASAKAPSTVAPAKSTVSFAKAPTVVSQAHSRPGAAPTVVSQAQSKASTQARSVTAPSRISVATAKTADQAAPKPKQGDVLETLMQEARNAATVARELVNSVRPSLKSSESAADTATGSGAGEAIVGATILGVAAGAALHYAFSNRSKETQSNDNADAEQRPSVIGRSKTEPAALMMRPEYEYEYAYSSGGSAACYEGPDGRVVTVYRAIEPAPSAYSEGIGHRVIEMHDNEARSSHLALPAPSHSGSKAGSRAGSQYASTVRPTSRSRRMSIDSGFGPGPNDLLAGQQEKTAGKSVISVASKGSKVSAISKMSRQSKMSGMTATPPTSYRAPTVLTTADTQASGSKSKSRSSSKSRTRSGSVSRILSRIGGSEADGPAADDERRGRSRSRSRVSHDSRRSRRDDVDGGDGDGARTVLHVSETLKRVVSRTHSISRDEAGGSRVSRVSSKSRQPHDYPLPPSRAATWAGGAGSEAGGSGAGGSFVSARSRPSPGLVVSAPRTIIGKLNPLRVRDFADRHEVDDSMSTVSKQKDLAKLDIPDREVRPEDSVSQISVHSTHSRRSEKAGSKAGSRRG
ncbi:hypothetical protein PV08_00618 [Exophiala spinifera]|uniref:VOC domain-containing protein n=1 Tax=Exophiala spinifera TaxID=91928 RepID=A0A0D2BMA4_9EURO|nr:uncharacterized protein PV08_00618 [Exophiala spinifera]KIW20043.1 hypothetical protein PV08_00618 [Exophiala spinifera]